MNVEIVAGPAAADGTMVATLPSEPYARTITGVSVTSTSTTPTVAAVYADSLYGAYLDATSTGNGDAGGAAGTVLPPGGRLLVRWSGASVGAEGRAVVGWS